MADQVSITRIQAILHNALTSLGWQHEPEEDGIVGGDQEYGLGVRSAGQLRRHPVYLWSDGTMSFHRSDDECGKVAATEIQSQIAPALAWLGFELEPNRKVGGDQKYTLPAARATTLRRRNIVTHSDGSLDFAE